MRFQILRLFFASRLAHHTSFAGSHPSSHITLLQVMTLWAEWALASIVADDGAATAGLPAPEEVTHDSTLSQNKTYLRHKALRQTHLLILEGGLGLARSNAIKGAACIGRHALVLRQFIAASNRDNLPSLLERLRERPILLLKRFLKSSRLWPLQSREASWKMQWSLRGQPCRWKRTSKGAPFYQRFLKNSTLWPLKSREANLRMQWTLRGQPCRRKRILKGEG